MKLLTLTLFSDKSGDVFKFQNNSDPPVLVLGHLSMLMDLLVAEASNGQKYILTCDRDEKIRVSCYPNAYNILNFCLGHTDFITKIQLIPGEKDIVLSSSGKNYCKSNEIWPFNTLWLCLGDGTLKIWNYLSCSELHSRLCYPDAGVEELKADPDERFENEEIKIKKRTSPAVKFFRVCTISDEIIIAAHIET